MYNTASDFHRGLVDEYLELIPEEGNTVTIRGFFDPNNPKFPIITEAKQIITKEVERNRRAAHLFGDSQNYCGTAGGFVKTESKVCYTGFDIDKVPNESEAKILADKIYKSLLGKHAVVTYSRNGNLHVLWYLTENNRNGFPSAESVYKFPFLYASALEFYTDKEQRQMGIAAKYFKNVRDRTYPSRLTFAEGETIPDRLLLDYYGGFKQEECKTACINPNTLERMSLYEFLEFARARRISGTVLKEQVGILEKLRDCCKRAYVQGVNEGNRDNATYAVITDYINNSKTATREKLIKIANFVVRGDPSFQKIIEGKVDLALEKQKANQLQYAAHIELFCDDVCKFHTKKSDKQFKDNPKYIIDGGEWNLSIVDSAVGKFYKHTFSYNGKSGQTFTRMGDLTLAKVDSEASEATECVFFTEMKSTKKNDVWRNELLPPKIAEAHAKPIERVKLIDLFDFSEVEDFYSFMVDLADMASRWIFQRNPNSPFCTEDAICISLKALMKKNKIIKKSKASVKYVLKNFHQRRVEEVSGQNLTVLVIPYSFYKEEDISCTIIDNPNLLEGIE